MKFRVRIESCFPRVQFLGMITSQRRRSVSRDQSRVNRVENCGNSGEYLLPELRMILSNIKIQIICIPSASDLFTPSNSTFVAVFRTRSTFSSSSILLHLFLWIFPRKEISSTLLSLLPFYTLSRRRWDNRRHRLFSSQFIEACFNCENPPMLTCKL